MKPYWYRLIKKLKAEGVITTGLTIPFIFGAYKEVGNPFLNVSEMMQEILDSEIDMFPVIQKCHVINKHVIMLESKNICNKTYIKDVKIKSEKCDNIMFVSSNTDLGKDIRRVCWNLTKEYEEPIKKGYYSWYNSKGIWNVYSDQEIMLIKSVNS